LPKELHKGFYSLFILIVWSTWLEYEMAMFFVRKVSRFSASSLISEMKPRSGSVLAFRLCQSSYNRNASLFFLLFLGFVVPAASVVE
jgi:hypothetical protein